MWERKSSLRPPFTLFFLKSTPCQLVADGRWMFEHEDDEAERRRGRGAAHLSRPWSRQPRGKHPPPPPPVKDSARLLLCFLLLHSPQPALFSNTLCCHPPQPKSQTPLDLVTSLVHPSPCHIKQEAAVTDREKPSAVPVPAITFQMDISASAPHPPLSPHCFFVFFSSF